MPSTISKKSWKEKRKSRLLCLLCFFLFFSAPDPARRLPLSLEDYTHHRGITSGCCCGSFVRISPLPPFTSPFFFVVLFIWSFIITLWWREIQFLIFSIAADVCLDPDRQGSKQISEYLGDILCFSLIMSIVCDVYYYGTMAKKSFIMQTTLTTSWREKIFFFFKCLGKDKRQIVCYQSTGIFNIFRSSWADYTADDTYMRTLEETRNFRIRGGGTFVLNFAVA